MSKKVINLNEYKDSQEDIENVVEELPSDILDEYLKQVENDTPDLWSRIDAGFEKEINLINNENKARRKKTVGFIAAAVLIVVIAIPVAILNVTNHKKNKDNTTTKNDSEKNIQTDESYNEAAVESEDADETYDSYEEITEAEEKYSADGYDFKEETITNNEVSGDKKEAEASSVEQSLDVESETQDDDIQNDMSEGAEASENEIAKEIVFKESAYVYAGMIKEEKIPSEYNVSEQIQNDFCDYSEKELTVIWTGDMGNTEYIYVMYGNTYTRYQRKDINSKKK